MFFKYALVFLAAMLVDIVPFPLPPAFVVMVILQIYFDLDVWTVIFVGVAGSILGRYVLTLYIPKVASKIFKPAKNEDVQFLGKKLKEKGWKGFVAILTYSLLPLPTTPLFIAGGMANMRPILMIPPFFIGKFTSDAIAVFMGKYTAESIPDIMSGILSWKTVTGLLIGLLLIVALLLINWRSLIQENKFSINYKIWK